MTCCNNSGRPTLAGAVVAACLCLATTATRAAAAAVRLSPYFSDHMVVQRDRPIAVWGDGDAGEKVQVSLGNAKAAATVGGDGTWHATLDAMPASAEPATLILTAAGKRTEVNDVLVGDVWLCSGQSNMQMSTKEANHGDDEAAKAGDYQTLRFLSVPKWGSDTPAAHLDATWKTSSTQVARDFSAVGFFFAVELMNDPAMKGVPIGLIDSSFGGTSAEGWTPPGKLDGVIPSDEVSASMFGIKTSALWNAMVNPLTPTSLRGVVWYQGEANAGRPGVYAKVLTAMIGGWRDAFAQPELPFILVQLPDFTGTMGEHFFTWTREAQAQVARDVPQVWVAQAVGTNDGSNLHPTEKQVIGRRAAMLAREHVYGENVVAEGPTMTAVKADGDEVRVTFDARGSTLADVTPDTPLRGFEVAGDDGDYRYAEAIIDGDSVMLKADGVPNPKTVRYAWAPVPATDLADAEGRPAAPFRTDDQPPRDIAVLQEPTPRRVRTRDYDVTISGFGKVTSLVFSRKQFLSNAPGQEGGTSMPVMFGERELRDVERPASDTIIYRDNSVAVTYAFDDKSMRWEIRPQQKEAVQFRLAVAPGVTVEPTGDGRFSLKKDDVTLQVTGFEKADKQPDGRTMLEVNAPAGGAATIEIKAGN